VIGCPVIVTVNASLEKRSRMQKGGEVILNKDYKEAIWFFFKKWWFERV